MIDFNDEDIKIFVKEKKEDDTETLLKLVEETNIQRNNGNTAKASKLGETIANLVFDFNIIEDEDFKNMIRDASVNEKVLYQIRLLLTFTAESTLHRSIHIPLLSTIAVNSMYETLMASDNELYEDTTDAFTFYYIALRKQNNIASRIGSRFAMLCGDESNEDYKKIGSGLYLILCEIICKEIQKTDFVTQ